MIWNILAALLMVCGNICISLYVQHRVWNPPPTAETGGKR